MAAKTNSVAATLFSAERKRGGKKIAEKLFDKENDFVKGYLPGGKKD